MEYEQIRQSAKMRLCRALSSVVFALLRDGIEKVRGSTPLISTTHKSVKSSTARSAALRSMRISSDGENPSRSHPSWDFSGKF